MTDFDLGPPAPTRRRFVGTALAGAAALAAAGIASSASANTQRPPKPAEGRANPAGRFAGKVVLVTGATSGIGEATATAFAMEGAAVHFCGRREELGDAVAKAIVSRGGTATYQRADVRVETDVKAFVAECVRRHGRVDIAFNNAGVANPPAPLHEQTLEAFAAAMDTNARGTFLCMREQIALMRRQGGGIIVNMASVSGHRAFPRLGHYAASKHAVIGLTKAAALENAEHNIRVNSISPLAVDTPQLRESFALNGATYEQFTPSSPIRRINTVEEMARAVMFLASDEASSVNGMDLDVTGGWLAR